MATNFYTLWTLLDNQDIKQVQIPIIQRDYAQGRQEEKANLIRNRFVEALYEAVAEQKPLVLDFVYGELEKGIFVPLDGQQRLTTLFLLHWYLAMVEEKLSEVQSVLTKFTYETRISSREFCRALVQEKVPEQEAFSELSKAIENAAWFQPAWTRDPTVAAMLTMLDALEARFGKPVGWLSRLTDKSQALIGFYFLNMPETGLSDDLYLKMNARGKGLTEFENWKAEFDLFLQKKHPAMGLQSLHKVFGQKVDGVWTDFFWQYRKSGTAEIDEAMERYLHYVTRMLAYQRSAQGEEFGDLTKERLPFACFEQIYSQPEAVQFLFDTLDFLAEVDTTPGGLNGLLGRLLSEQAIPSRVRLFGAGERVALVEQCLRGTLTRQGEVLLFGLLSLAAANGGQLPNEEAACDLLRVLRNLLERVRQQNETALKSNMRASDLPAFAAAVQILAANSSEVYKQLHEGVDLPSLSEQSVAYEREKAVLIVTQPQLKLVLHGLEDRLALHGDLHNLRLTEYVDRVPDFARAVEELWSESEPLPQDLLIRAWLTVGDYSITQWRWTQMGHKFFFGNKANWYTVLATDRIKQAESLLPAFLEAYLHATGTDTRQKLIYLIDNWLAANNGKHDWRYYFIKYPEMSANSSGYYAWADGSDFRVRLLKSIDLRGKHVNPYVRTVAARKQTADAVWDRDEHDQGVNGNNSSPLWLRNIPGVPVEIEQPKLHCEDAGWRLELAENCVVEEALIKTHNLQPNGSGQWWLMETNAQDRIERAEIFIADLRQQGIQYNEPESETLIKEIDVTAI